MSTKFTQRAMVVCAAVAAIIIGFTPNAQAANAGLILSDRDGRQMGAMTHLDPEPDRFKVCDTQRDGATVTGRVFDGTELIGITTDGDDAGCNYFYASILKDHQTWMSICWEGAVGFCNSRRIYE